MISEGYRTNGGVTGPMKFKKKDVFFSENRASGILGTLLAIQAPYLTLQTPLWPVTVSRSPYA